VGTLEDAPKIAFADKVVELKRESLAAHPIEGVDGDTVTVDTPIPFSIRRLWWDFHTAMRATHFEDGQPQSRANWALELDAHGQPIQAGDQVRVIPPRFRALKDDKGDPEKIRASNSRLSVSRPTDILAGRLRDQRLAFLFSPGPWACDDPEGVPSADLDELLETWIGGEHPISILDLSGVPPTVQSDLVGALLRVLFEALFWARALPEGGKSRPLLIVLEEAHSYLGADGKSAASAAVQRIAKEGRKYGLGLMIVSQRPAEIDQTILSQCGTLMALRLSNATDRSHISSAVSDSLEGLLSSLPILRTGEAIILGEAVSLPIRALITPPSRDRLPESEDPQLVHPDPEGEDSGGVGGWNAPSPPRNYARLVDAWRRQSARTLHGNQEGEELMEWIPVSSTNVTALAYDAGQQIMWVEFKAGNRYQYFDVPEQVFDACLAASSVGSFFNSQIKNAYRHSRE
jgi:hypothetical protein